MKPPTNPITLALNGLLVNMALAKIEKERFPGYKFRVTSAYRSPVVNARTPGASATSAHMWNLARDFVIEDETGKQLNDSAMNTLYKAKFLPNWEGYSYFSYKKPHTSSGWIHANLSKNLTNSTFIAGLVGTLGIGWLIYKSIQKRRTAK